MTRTKDSTLRKEYHFSKNIHERHELVKTKSLWLLFTLPSLKTDKESIPWSPFPQREKTASEKIIPVFSQCPIWVHRWTRNRFELPTQMPTKRFYWSQSQRENKTTPNSTDGTTYRRVEKTHQGCLSPLAEHWSSHKKAGYIWWQMLEIFFFLIKLEFCGSITLQGKIYNIFQRKPEIDQWCSAIK